MEVIDGRLNQVNGSVASIKEEQIRIKLEIVNHPPQEAIARIEKVESRVSEVETRIIAEDAARKATKGSLGWVWSNFLRPLATALITALFILILYNAQLFVPRGGSTSISTQTTSKTTNSRK